MRDKDVATSSGFEVEGTRPRLTPLDIQQKEFRVSFRGYNERDVDEFLDLVTAELQRYEGELMRLRSERAAFDPESFDLDAETQRIIRDARERAESIVREAEARAAGIPTASGGETRAVVAPYLNREREFLQSLGSLVQEHAQTIRTMVEEARRRTEEPPRAQAVPPSSGATAAGVEGSAPAGEELVVLSPDRPGGAAGEQERQPEGARSLRELFWGED